MIEQEEPTHSRYRLVQNHPSISMTIIRQNQSSYNKTETNKFQKEAETTPTLLVSHQKAESIHS